MNKYVKYGLIGLGAALVAAAAIFGLDELREAGLGLIDSAGGVQ